MPGGSAEPISPNGDAGWLFAKGVQCSQRQGLDWRSHPTSDKLAHLSARMV